MLNCLFLWMGYTEITPEFYKMAGMPHISVRHLGYVDELLRRTPRTKLDDKCKEFLCFPYKNCERFCHILYHQRDQTTAVLNTVVC